MATSLYLQAKAHLLAVDPDAAKMLEWTASHREVPQTPEKLAGEIVWIILCAGRSAQAARTIEARVWSAIRAGKPAVEGFGYRAKAAAIDLVWAERERNFRELQAVAALGDPLAMVKWCGSLPYVGKISRYQLCKNLGMDVCKPDLWLRRLSGIPDLRRINADDCFWACMDFCRHLSAATGDSCATVDSVCWLACNKGVLVVGADAGPVSFNSESRGRGSIYAAG